MSSRIFRPARNIKDALKSVIYLDRGTAVLQKPPGLVCQLDTSARGRTNEFNLLLNDLSRSLGAYPFPVHRLDKGTTGALILARHLPDAKILSQQFQSRTVEKTYLALVRGGEKSFASKSGEIQTPIQYEDGRASLALSPNGPPSITEWELVASSPTAPLSLLRLRLHTGHKHQLRVHLAHCLKTPILGDTLYSKKQPSEAITQITTLPEDRVFLHASHVSFFRYRSSGPKKRFRLGISAPLPVDFLTICADAGIRVEPTEAKGGVFIDGVLVEDGKVPEVEGIWMPRLKEPRK